MTDTREKPSPYDPEAVRRALRTVRDARPDPVTTPGQVVVDGCAHAEMTHPLTEVKVRLFACAACIGSALDSARREAEGRAYGRLSEEIKRMRLVTTEAEAELRASKERLRERDREWIERLGLTSTSMDGAVNTLHNIEVDRLNRHGEALARLREKDEELREAQAYKEGWIREAKALEAGLREKDEEIARLTKINELRARIINTLPLCPDHRDKEQPNTCVRCECERLERDAVNAAARSS